MTNFAQDLSTRKDTQHFILDLARGSVADIESAIMEASKNRSLDQLFPGFALLADCEQGSLHHCEGNALVHTAKVFANLSEISAEMTDDDRYILLAAALCHDIEKPSTYSLRGDKVTFYGHAERAAERCPEFAANLHLSATEEERFSFLVRNHMTVHFLLKQEEEKRLEIYESPHFTCLAMLQKADALSSWKSPDGSIHGEVLLSRFEEDRKQLIDKKTAAAHQSLLFSQMTETLKSLGLAPGPYYGEVKKALKEEIEAGRVSTVKEVDQWVRRFYKEGQH